MGAVYGLVATAMPLLVTTCLITNTLERVFCIRFLFLPKNLEDADSQFGETSVYNVF